MAVFSCVLALLFIIKLLFRKNIRLFEYSNLVSVLNSNIVRFQCDSAQISYSMLHLRASFHWSHLEGNRPPPC